MHRASYQTQYTDPSTGDVLAQSRWYSPGTGTFRSRDTWSGDLNTPVTLNRYTYANNNPIRYDDPSGRCANYVFDTCVDRVAITRDSSGFDDLGTTRIGVNPTSVGAHPDAEVYQATNYDPETNVATASETEYIVLFNYAPDSNGTPVAPGWERFTEQSLSKYEGLANNSAPNSLQDWQINVAVERLDASTPSRGAWTSGFGTLLATAFGDPRSCVGATAGKGRCGIEIAGILPWGKFGRLSRLLRFGDEVVDLGLRAPNSRHLLTRVNQNTFARPLNTVVEPGIDVAGDVRLINAGGAALDGQNFLVNGRTYGAHNGTLFPISGPGFHQLTRQEFKILGVLNQVSDMQRASTTRPNLRYPKLGSKHQGS